MINGKPVSRRRQHLLTDRKTGHTLLSAAAICGPSPGSVRLASCQLCRCMATLSSYLLPASSGSTKLCAIERSGKIRAGHPFLTDRYRCNHAHNPCFHTGNKDSPCFLLVIPGRIHQIPEPVFQLYLIPHMTFPAAIRCHGQTRRQTHTESQTGCRESETSLHSPRRRPCGHIKRRRRLTMPVHLLPVSPHMSAVYRHNCGSHEAIPRLSCRQPTGYSPPHFVLPPKILPCRLQRPDIPHAVRMPILLYRSGSIICPLPPVETLPFSTHQTFFPSQNTSGWSSTNAS